MTIATVEKGRFQRYGRDKLEVLRASFESAPEVERMYTVKELIADLAKPIDGMRSKGYSLEQIVEQFKASGIEIKLSTLRAALRVKKAPGKAAGKTAQRGKAEAAGASA